MCAFVCAISVVTVLCADFEIKSEHTSLNLTLKNKRSQTPLSEDSLDGVFVINSVI